MSIFVATQTLSGMEGNNYEASSTKRRHLGGEYRRYISSPFWNKMYSINGYIGEVKKLFGTLQEKDAEESKRNEGADVESCSGKGGSICGPRDKEEYGKDDSQDGMCGNVESSEKIEDVCGNVHSGPKGHRR